MKAEERLTQRNQVLFRGTSGKVFLEASMNPFFHSAIHSTLATFIRECPMCRHKQVTAPSKAGEAVQCRKCGAQIPPKKAA